MSPNEVEKIRDQLSISDNKMESSTKSNPWRIFFAVFIMAAFIMTSLQISLAGSVVAADEQVLTLGFAESITSANPYIGIYDADYLFYSYVYDYLMFPNEDGQPTPNLAKDWYFMDGPTAAASGTSFAGLPFSDPDDWPLGSIWHYNITPNVFWNDGVPFSSDDVKWTYDIQIGANFMTYWAYQPVTRWVDHVDKVGDDAVRIFFCQFESRQPIPVAWGNSLSVPIMPKHAFEGKPTTYIAQQWNGLPAIGTGIFKGTSNLGNEIIAKEFVTLEYNQYYNYTENGAQLGLGGYFNRHIEIDKLVMKFFSEEQTQVLSLKTGAIDACELTPANYLAMQGDANLAETVELISMYSATVYTKISHWNVKEESSGSLNPARLDPAIHRASMLATDRDLINEAVFKNLGTPGYGIITPVWPEWYWEPDDVERSWFNVTDENGTIVYSYNDTIKHILDFDIDRANAILDAAGYEWTGTEGQSVREIGPVAAKRLVAMGYATDYSSIVGMDLTFEQIIIQEVFEDKEIGAYLTSSWADIGLNMIENLVNLATWNSVVYTYTFHFTETYWSADVDPNYILYVVTSYSIDGWNEWGTENKTYDYYYDMQAQTLDYTERKHWVDECLKWQYLYSGMIVTSYPKICFAYNDGLRWTNWGDWEAHPGLAIDHFWGEAPLFYHITWAGEGGGPAADITGIVMAAGVVVAIIAAITAFMLLRKRKEKMLLEEEEDEEESEGLTKP